MKGGVVITVLRSGKHRFLYIVLIVVILILTVIVLDSIFDRSFSVEMHMRDDEKKTVNIEVVLPSTTYVEDIVFRINDQTYTIDSSPVVSRPIFVLEDLYDDAYASVCLKLADEMSGIAELTIVTNDGEELTYFAPMKYFENLVVFLRTN